MKNNYISFKRMSKMLLFFFIGSLFFLSSCQDDENAGAGAPIIERVRYTDPNTADSSFEKATLGSTLAIIGKNLATTEMVYLNDYPIGVNPVYATDNHLIVQVSDSIPTIAQSENIPHTLRVVNPYGETTFRFETLPPAPIIEQVGNEMVQPGDQLTLYGKYFYFVDTVFLPGDVFVTEGITTASNGSWVSVTVPEGFKPSVGDLDVIVSSESGNSRATRTSRVFGGSGIVADFDVDGPFQWPQNGSADWGWGIPSDNIVNSAPGIEPIDGHFAMVYWTLPPNWGWANEKLINLADWAGDQIFPVTPKEIYDSLESISSFDARMEITVSQPSSIEGVEVNILAYTTAGVEISFGVPLSDFVKTTDGTWYTLSVPLSKLANQNNKLSTYKDLLLGGSRDDNDVLIHQFRVNFINTTGDAIDLIAGVDNIRIVNATYSPEN